MSNGRERRYWGDILFRFLFLRVMAGGDTTRGTSDAESASPAVVRSRETRLTGGRIVATLVFDRPLTPDELARFYRQPANGRPIPLDFFIDGKSARYECEPKDEPKWRLAFEIYLVKAFRVDKPRATGSTATGAAAGSNPSKPTRDTGIRNRAGMRKLHLG